jgi:hypothetical protein
MWFRASFGDKGFVLALFQNLAHIAVGIIQIAEIHAFRRTNGNACGEHSLPYPVNAEGAFVYITFGMRVACVIGA